ncbi:MAG TPA: hypothetical protein VK762_30895 [Polyangiaceae bacterium]|jgi:hypothetical protein|nr:hypothetical protein [Polyangiaceae bacterium]
MSVRRTVPPPPDTQPSLEIVPRRRHACRWRRLVEGTWRELETIRAEVTELRAARDAADAKVAAALDQLIGYERGPVGRVVPLSRELRSTGRLRNGGVEKKPRSRSRSTA